MKEARYKATYLWFHLYEIPRIEKSIETENRWVVARGWGKRSGIGADCWWVHGLLWGWGSILELESDDGCTTWEITKNHWNCTLRIGEFYIMWIISHVLKIQWRKKIISETVAICSRELWVFSKQPHTGVILYGFALWRTLVCRLPINKGFWETTATYLPKKMDTRNKFDVLCNQKAGRLLRWA